MFSNQVLLHVRSLPDEGGDAYNFVLDSIESAKTQTLLSMYGFTDQKIALSLVNAFKRGVDVWIILDHSETTTPVEAKLLHWILGSGFPANRICICTSERHQIMHRKVLIIDSSIVITGSTNFSPDGFLQANHFIHVVDPLFAQFCIEEFSEQWNWAAKNETSYQSIVLQTFGGQSAQESVQSQA